MNPVKKDLVPALVRRGVPERTATAATKATLTDAIAKTPKGDLIILSGSPGVGKSVAACIWLVDVCRGKPECMRWIQSGDLARGYSYNQESFDQLIQAYALVIDDCGIDFVDEKGRFLTTLEEVISKRFSRLRPTLITTNIANPAEFRDRYGARIASRINEDGAFIVCGGPDLRKWASKGKSPPAQQMLNLSQTAQGRGAP
jgi:DNA replication protein DnaC